MVLILFFRVRDASTEALTKLEAFNIEMELRFVFILVNTNREDVYKALLDYKAQRPEEVSA